MHWLAHLFGFNHGNVESFWVGDDLWIGFRCSGCNEINGAQIARKNYRTQLPLTSKK